MGNGVIRVAMHHKGTVPLQSGRLLLRRYTLLDADTMYKNYAADERVTRFLSWPPYQNAQDILPFLRDAIQGYSSNKCYNWAIEYKQEIIGSISVTSLDEKNAACEIGYCIGYNFWNQGMMSEAVQTVIAYLFQEINMHRIMAKHDGETMASGRVMQKNGMTYEGTLRGYYIRNDKTIGNALVYGITAEDFNGVQV